MKTLFVLRHAKSSWKNTSLTDFERPLKKKGMKDANLMGKFLKSKGISPDLIVSSTALRAFSTAEIIADRIGYDLNYIKPEKELYAADVDGIMDILNEIPEEVVELMIVGHNPGFTDLVNYLTNYSLDNLATCGLVCIRFDCQSWQDIATSAGSVEFHQVAKKLRH